MGRTPLWVLNETLQTCQSCSPRSCFPTHSFLHVFTGPSQSCSTIMPGYPVVCTVAEEYIGGSHQGGLRLLASPPERNSRLATFKVFGLEPEGSAVHTAFVTADAALRDPRSYGRFAIEQKSNSYWGVAQYEDGYLAAAANHASLYNRNRTCNARIVVKQPGPGSLPDCYLLHGNSLNTVFARKDKAFIHL